MLSTILQPIEKELQTVHNLIKKQFIIKAGHVGSFAHLELSFLNKMIRPALVILTARIYGCDPKKTAALASVFQFIYLASKIHQEISENDSDYIRGDSDPRDGSQFPVLVGDYLYGKFFTFLCDAGIINLLQPLAEIICQIHEGGILRKKISGTGVTSQVFREVVSKETAGLFAGCCSLTARLAGAAEDDEKLLRNFGHNLGMACGFLENGAPVEYVSSYIDEAVVSLSLLPDKPERAVLEELALNLSGLGLPARRMVI